LNKELLWKLFKCELVLNVALVADILQVTVFIAMHTNHTLTMAPLYILTKSR